MVKASQRSSAPQEPKLGDKYLGKFGKRHAEAERVDREISSMAFPHVGAGPGAIETFAGEDPSSMFSGGNMQGNMLSHEQTLRKWEVPELPPSHGAGFGSSVATNEASGGLKSEGSLGKEVNALAERMAPGGHHDPLGSMVTSRRSHIQQSLASGRPDDKWYQGKAQAMIYTAAKDRGVSTPLMRKVTAAESSKMPWDETLADNPQNRRSGRAGQTQFPNLANAARITDEAVGQPEDEAVRRVKAAKIAGVGRESAAIVASRMSAGTLTGYDPMPMKGMAEKRRTFEVNLSDPTHDTYGYSPYVHRHQLSGHTSDVQDARSAGAHEDFLEVPRPINPSTGNPIGKPWHEEALQKPAGADMFHATALVARTEEFQAQRATHGEEWAKQNAMNFMAGPSQSMQWSVARTTGAVDIPAHAAETYANRPAPTGFQGHGDDEMTDEDWAQM